MQIFSNQGLLNVGEFDSGVAHVERSCRNDPRDTDNSWAENDLWAVHLGLILLIHN